MTAGGEAIGFDSLSIWMTRLESVKGWVNPWMPTFAADTASQHVVHVQQQRGPDPRRPDAERTGPGDRRWITAGRPSSPVSGGRRGGHPGPARAPEEEPGPTPRTSSSRPSARSTPWSRKSALQHAKAEAPETRKMHRVGRAADPANRRPAGLHPAAGERGDVGRYRPGVPGARHPGLRRGVGPDEDRRRRSPSPARISTLTISCSSARRCPERRR